MDVSSTQDERGRPANDLLKKLESTAFERIKTSSYEFCCFMRDLYVPDDAILVPPEDGWPQITTETFTILGKSDIVVNALKHMTYIEDKCTPFQYEILPETVMCDWRESSTIHQLKAGKVDAVRIITERAPMSADVVGLTIGGRECAWILLDCRYGILEWKDSPEKSRAGPMVKDVGLFKVPEDCGWVDSSVEGTWIVEDFLEHIKDKFRTMKQLPRDAHKLIAYGDKDMDDVKAVYREHGWPDEFRKEECAAAIAAIDT
ncbi:hypothetical protein LTS08_007641 [Lithohypha guttulata]|nr:hypothetical protein LTS08_007641 [Lithohypha guttulata]